MTDDNDKVTIELLPATVNVRPLRPIKNALFDDILAVFHHWKVILDHPRAKLDDVRTKAIANALRLYSVSDLCCAIDGCASSHFHMGDNKDHTVYDSITLIFRNSEKIEWFIEKGELAHRMLDEREARKAQAQDKWQPPSDEEKAKVRDMLKSLRMRRVA